MVVAQRLLVDGEGAQVDGDLARVGARVRIRVRVGIG